MVGGGNIRSKTFLNSLEEGLAWANVEELALEEATEKKSEACLARWIVLYCLCALCFVFL